MKKKIGFWLAMGMGLMTGSAMADDTMSGQIGTYVIYTTFGYDLVYFAGSPDVCTDTNIPANRRKEMRLVKSDLGYESASKLILAAKLAGQSLRITADAVGSGSEARCTIKKVELD